MWFLSRAERIIIGFLLLVIQGCGSAQLISQQSVEDKIAQVKPGITTMNEVESLFGTQHSSENKRWFYSLSDTTFDVSEPKRGTLAAVLPVAAGTVTTNTRVVISLRFTDSGKVSGFEVERFFDPPFINDYWYIIKDDAQNVFDSVMRSAEASGFRVAESDKAAGMFTLENSADNARVIVKLENLTLHITSKNPYDRLTGEYHMFAKRERSFINKISAADFLR